MSEITLNSMKSIDQKLKILIDKLKGTLDKNNKLAEEYFSHLKDNKASFEDYLRFLEKCVLSQLNEKYEENKEKYGSKKKYDDHQKGLLGLFIDVDNYLRENYLLSDLNLRGQYVEFMNKVNLEVKDSLDEKRFSWAKSRCYKEIINKLNTDIDNGKKFLKGCFLYLNKSSLRQNIINIDYEDYLEFLTQVILPQINEKYDDNAKKYDSKEKYEKYQSGLFDVLVEVNDYLWENYLFLDRSLRLEYADKVISKINGGCLKRFLCTRKDEIKKSGDQKKISAYNKVLDGFFYRNIRSLIFSREQCKDLSAAFNKNNVDNLPNWIDQYIDPSNQNDFLTALSGDFVPLTDKIKSFNWNEKLDENNKIAREYLEYIKEINKDVTDPKVFNFYAQFLEEIVIPQMNKFLDEERYANGLFGILFETNDLIWKILESNSLSEYEKKRLSARYYNVIEKINGYTWERIGNLLYKRKEEAIKSREKNKVVAYNELVKNLILRNVKNDIISADQIDNMHVVNLIDEKTFEEYTDNSMIKKLFNLFAFKRSYVSTNIRNYSIVKIREPKDEKICFESKFGSIMNSIYWGSADNMLGLLKNNSDEMDFSFSSLSNKDVESNEEIKKFYLGFRSVYDDLNKNDFTVHISESSLETRKCFMYLGSWVIPFFSKNVDFNTVYTELSKRLDFLFDGHYGLSKLQINQKQKDKLISQTLVYATNSLCPLSRNNPQLVYRTLRMFTGEGKFVDDYKFSLDDMEKILSSTKNSVLNSFGVLEFCKNHRAKNVQLFDILMLAQGMDIAVSGKRQAGCNVCLKNDRKERCGITGYYSTPYNLFNEDDFKTYILESPKNLKEEKFDMWFSFFLTKPILPKKRSSYENKEIREVFVQIVDKIPDEYLNAGEFYSLVNYFVSEDTANAINLHPDEFNNFISKVKKQMDEECFKSFKKMTTQYFKIDGREISDQEIEDAYNNVKNSVGLAFEDEDIDEESISNDEIVNENNNQNNNMGAADAVYFNINKVESESYNDLSSNEQKNKNVKNVEDMNINKDINKDEIENEDNNQSVSKPIYPNINEVEPKDSTESPMNNSQNKNNSAYNTEIVQIKAKIKELQDRRVSLEEQISNMKGIAGELSNRNWFVRKFLRVFYYILHLIKESELNKIDTQLNKLQNQLKEMGSTDQTDISDRISYPPATEQTIPDMQRDGMVPNQNK